MKIPTKCSFCDNPAIFTVVENREKIPLCVYHYKIENQIIMNENKGVAM